MMQRLAVPFAMAMLVLAGPAWAQQGDGAVPNGPVGPYGMWGGGWGYHHFWGFHVFLTILFVFVLVAVLRRAWWGSGYRRGRVGLPGGQALDILEERFVKGEISREEFEDKRKVLRRRLF